MFGKVPKYARDAKNLNSEVLFRLFADFIQLYADSIFSRTFASSDLFMFFVHLFLVFVGCMFLLDYL